MRSWLFAFGLIVSLATSATAQSGTPFTDDPLVPRVTVIKAVHVTELRTWINARRVARGLGNFTFTDSGLSIGVTPARAIHINELRTALAQVYASIGRPLPVYTDPVLSPTSTIIKVVHIAELRAAVAALEQPGPWPVNLGAAGMFAILSKSGITDVPPSSIVGNVGTSPITGAAIHLTCTEVSGTIYAVDAAGPQPCAVTNGTLLGSAIGAMGTAYTDAAGRSSPDFIDLGAGQIGGRTLVPGLYKWNTDLLITTDVTLSGGANAVWIFQVTGELVVGNGAKVFLSGGALPKNIFWQVTEAVTLGTTAHFEGIVLGQTMIAAKTGASVTGRLLAQTAVTLQANAVTAPAP